MKKLHKKECLGANEMLDLSTLFVPLHDYNFTGLKAVFYSHL
jgi:hypothetical protein